MKVEITYCDYCDRCYNGDDETRVYSFSSYPKMGEEGYLIDQENIDLCLDCLKDYKKKYPNHNIFRIDRNGKTQIV